MEASPQLENSKRDFTEVTKIARLSPIWWRDAILQRLFFPLIFREKGGVRVLNESWNNLIILDACRFDAFQAAIKQWKVKGTLEMRTSQGTNTSSFLRKNFRGKFYDDIVYVTANPHVNRVLSDSFHTIVPVWMTDWDENARIVLPEAVVRRASEALAKFTDKRFIIHFLQPHFPYLGIDLEGESREQVVGLGLRVYPSYDGIWYKKYKELGVKQMRTLYLRGLVRVLDCVTQLLPLLPGRTIITADHGEAFGEFLHRFIPIGVMRHPAGIRIRELVRVPWYTIEGAPLASQRHQTPENKASEVPARDEAIISQRLRDLGYS